MVEGDRLPPRVVDITAPPQVPTAIYEDGDVGNRAELAAWDAAMNTSPPGQLS